MSALTKEEIAELRDKAHPSSKWHIALDMALRSIDVSPSATGATQSDATYTEKTHDVLWREPPAASVTVPRKPTEAMRKAGSLSLYANENEIDIYRAMLAAAPAPAVASATGATEDLPFHCDAWARRVHKCDKQCDSCFRKQYDRPASGLSQALDQARGSDPYQMQGAIFACDAIAEIGTGERKRVAELASKSLEWLLDNDAGDSPPPFVASAPEERDKWVEFRTRTGLLSYDEAPPFRPIECNKQCSLGTPYPGWLVSDGKSSASMSYGFNQDLKFWDGKRVRITIEVTKDDYEAKRRDMNGGTV